MKKNNILRSLALALILLLAASQAMAHAAIVWAYVEGGRVFVEAFFANGTKIQNTKVVVLNDQDEVLLEGLTDVDGKFSYTPPNKSKQIILVMAGDAHLGDFEISEEDLAEVKLKR